MSVTIQPSSGLFDGGPPLRVQRSLGLVKPDKPRIAQRAALVALTGWTPLAVLAAVQILGLRDEAAKSFFTDFAAYARFLVAAPFFILAERDCLPRLGRISNHFLEAGLIIEAERARFDAAVASTQQQLNSKAAEIGALLLAYAVSAALIIFVPAHQFPAWHRSQSGTISIAGCWHILVSAPLLLLLFFGWLWRVLLWGRFLWLMARLHLRLIPSHPDHAGGLWFVSTSLRAFRLLSFAYGAVAAGVVGNHVVHQGASPVQFKNTAIALAVFVVVVFAGPLTIFLNQLRNAKRRGVFEYGVLAGDLGQHFERKWVKRPGGVDAGALEVGDFSATTDLYQVVANVYDMRDVPFGLKNLGFLVAAALVPFVPVALLSMPLKELIQGLAKMML